MRPNHQYQILRLPAERQNHMRLCALCETGGPREVLGLIRTSGFDCAALKKKFLVHEASPIPVHPTAHPFLTACEKRNDAIVRLLLELGADPDANCCAHSGVMTPRWACENEPELQSLFEGGRLWWKVKYSESRRRELQCLLEDCVRAGEASEAAWRMAKGVSLPSPAVLASPAFARRPTAFKELVCRMGIPAERRAEYLSRLKANRADAEVVQILDTLLRTGGDEGRDIMEKLLLSLELLGEERAKDVFPGAFGIQVKISLLGLFIDAHDSCERPSFIENGIAALFKEILCACMEV